MSVNRNTKSRDVVAHLRELLADVNNQVLAEQLYELAIDIKYTAYSEGYSQGYADGKDK